MNLKGVSKALSRWAGKIEKLSNRPTLTTTVKGVADEKVALARPYLREIERITKLNIPAKQVKELRKALQSTKFERLSAEDAKIHRREFEKVKNKLRQEWEENTGRKWPTYDQDLITKAGKILPRKDKPYDAHHIIQNNYAGPNKWWNIHPAHGVLEHPKIHGKLSKNKAIFK